MSSLPTSKYASILNKNAARLKEQRERDEREKVAAAQSEVDAEVKRKRTKVIRNVTRKLSPRHNDDSDDDRDVSASPSPQPARRDDDDRRGDDAHDTARSSSAPMADLEDVQSKRKRDRHERRRIASENEAETLTPREETRERVTPTNTYTIAESASADDEGDVDVEETPLPPGARIYEVRRYRLPDSKVSAIQRKLKGFKSVLDVRNRRYLWEGAIKRQGQWSVVDRWIYLFTDIIVIAKATGAPNDLTATLLWKQTIELDGCEVDVRVDSKVTRLPNAFIVRATLPHPQSYVLSCRTADETHDWIRRIQLAISRVMWASKDERVKEYGWYHRVVSGTLHRAVLDNDVAAITALLADQMKTKGKQREQMRREQKGASERDQEGLTAAHIAAHMNYHTLIPLLTAAGADITLRDSEGLTPIHVAAKFGYLQSVNAFLLAADMNVALYHPLRSLLKQHVPVPGVESLDYKLTSAIWLAAIYHLREYESSIKSLLTYARENNDIRAREMMDARDHHSNTILETAVYMSLSDVVPTLVSLGATLDAVSEDNDTTPLCLAAEKGDMDMVVTLVQLGAQPNLRMPQSLNTPAHFAASLEVASYLVSNGARFDLRNRRGQRLTDIYGTPSQLSTLEAAAGLSQSRRTAETTESMRPRPTTESMNGGHTLDCCAFCQTEFSSKFSVAGIDIGKGLGIAEGQKDWCRRCGFAADSACLQKVVTFVSDNDDREDASVCDGCFNIVNFRPETTDKRKQRLERQRKEAAENESPFSLSNLASLLTAVHITHAPSTAPRSLMTYQGLIIPAEQDAVEALKQDDYRTTFNKPTHVRTRSVGPAATGGRQTHVVDYNTGNVMLKQSLSPHMALNNAPVIIPSSSSPSLHAMTKSSPQRSADSRVSPRGMSKSSSHDEIEALRAKKTSTRAADNAAPSKERINGRASDDADDDDVEELTMEEIKATDKSPHKAKTKKKSPAPSRQHEDERGDSDGDTNIKSSPKIQRAPSRSPEADTDEQEETTESAQQPQRQTGFSKFLSRQLSKLEEEKERKEKKKTRR